ncbi:hypothetical protein ANANG_G00273130 [Anguilla anguilla]|uniref:Uncharacterized protein n=1 Tax=Anguilla anguilla TaxID=7936 RepID=A0A9D3LM88_ANGAN|nr:hypothetical protein ANANG_G00273130 [Anguilla anguilla]
MNFGEGSSKSTPRPSLGQCHTRHGHRKAMRSLGESITSLTKSCSRIWCTTTGVCGVRRAQGQHVRHQHRRRQGGPGRREDLRDRRRAARHSVSEDAEAQGLRRLREAAQRCSHEADPEERSAHHRVLRQPGLQRGRLPGDGGRGEEDGAPVLPVLRSRDGERRAAGRVRAAAHRHSPGAGPTPVGPRLLAPPL